MFIFGCLIEQDDQGSTALHIAAELNLGDAIEKILSVGDGAQCLDIKDKASFRAIHRAAAGNAKNSIQSLIAGGASTNVVTSSGYTPLHIALNSCAFEAWAALIEGGAENNIRDKWGRTALELAATFGFQIDPVTQFVVVTVTNTISTTSSSSLVMRTPTAILSHPLCMRHFTCAPSETEGPQAPPENIKRISVLLDPDAGILRSADLAADIKWIPDSKSAAMADVLRVHEWSYVRKIQGVPLIYALIPALSSFECFIRVFITLIDDYLTI